MCKSHHKTTMLALLSKRVGNTHSRRTDVADDERLIMASREAVKRVARQVKPILSLDKNEARKRVFNLYKAWYRQIPYIVMDYDIPKNIPQCRAKLREEFEKNRNVQDIRVIDMLVIKGQMELRETVNLWKQKGHVMGYFKETIEPKPTDFLSKFFSGNN